jgi:hypothetical protein
MSSRTISALRGFAVGFYIIAALGALVLTLIAMVEEEWIFFGIGLGSGMTVAWFGLVLDGLSVIAKNTERSAILAEKSTGRTESLATAVVSEELPEL